MRKEVDAKIRDSFKVYNLIGKDCQYSTFGNFVNAFHKFTNENIQEHKARLVSLSNLIEKNNEITKSNKNRIGSIEKQIKDLQTQDAHFDSAITSLNIKLAKVVTKTNKTFSDQEFIFIK